MRIRAGAIRKIPRIGRIGQGRGIRASEEASPAGSEGGHVCVYTVWKRSSV